MGVCRTGGYLGSFSVNHMLNRKAVIFLRTFPREAWSPAKGKWTITGLHALCSWYGQQDKSPQRHLAVPEASVSGGWGWGAFECKQHSRLKRANYADSKKKTFSKMPVGKFELPTAPQGHLELAVEPFLWISVKF